MSSTNRGYDRHVADYYVTPKKDVEVFLNKFIQCNKISNPEKLKWLDPCCGGDKDNEVLYLSVIKEKYNPKNIIGIDIRDDSHADIVTSYLDVDGEIIYDNDIIISNPPFYLAEEFVKKSLENIKEGGYVIMLLRLNFFGSQKRKELFDDYMPKYCFIHRKRINFIPDSMKKQMKLNGDKVPSGDSIEYAHFVWQKGYTMNYTQTFII